MSRDSNAPKKELSVLQEKEIAKHLGGKVQAGSGGTAFGGGDVHTELFLIEAKTLQYHRKQLIIKEEWIAKMRTQAYEQRKPYCALAIRFDPYGEDCYVIDKTLMKFLVDYLEGTEESEQ